MRALPLAWRAFGDMRIHSSSRSQRLLPLAFGLFLLAQPLLLLFQPRRVVAFERNALAAIEFQNPTGDVVEKISVMGNGDDRARITLQVMFEPRHRFGIEMVGRLVEQKNIGLLQEQPAQCNAAAFAAGQDLSPASPAADSAAHPSPSPAAHRDPRRLDDRASPAPRLGARAACSCRRRTSPRQTWR